MSSLTKPAELLFAAAIKLAGSHFEGGTDFVRIASFSDSIDYASLIERLTEAFPEHSIACFEPASNLDESELLTSKVGTAVRWRDTIGIRLLIVGDLVQDGAAGLTEIRTVEPQEIVRELLRQAEAKAGANKLKELLVSLNSVVSDPDRCSRYLSAVNVGMSGDSDRSRSELWMLGLLPDSGGQSQDRKRLKLNMDTVSNIASKDRKVFRKLAGKAGLATNSTYASLSQFADTQDSSLLKELELNNVLSALKGSSGLEDKGGEPSDPEIAAPSFPEVLDSSGLSNQAFRDAIDDWTPEKDSVDLEGTEVEWEAYDVREWTPLLTDINDIDDPGEIGSEEDNSNLYESTVSAIVVGASQTAGRIAKRASAAEEFVCEYTRLEYLQGSIAKIESRASQATSEVSSLFSEIRADREILLPWIGALPNEGIKLFWGASDLFQTGRRYVDNWVKLYDSLEKLKSQLTSEDAGFIRDLVQMLTKVDLSIEQTGSNIECTVLPLHPIFLEPRLRATEALRGEPGEWERLHELIRDTLDPGTVFVSVDVDDEQHKLTFAGLENGLPRYSRAALLESPRETAKVAVQVARRFTVSHPYAKLGLSVCLIKPAPDVAGLIYRALAETALVTGAYLRFAVVSEEPSVAATTTAISAEHRRLIDKDNPNVEYLHWRVIEADGTANLPAAVDSIGSPHLLYYFNPSPENEYSAAVDAMEALRASVISEWMFKVNPLNNTPIITPSSKGIIDNLLRKQSTMLGFSHTAIERQPLLKADIESLLGGLVEKTGWLVDIEASAARSAANSLGTSDLVGSLSAGAVSGHVYTTNTRPLSSPVGDYLVEQSWLATDAESLENFLLTTVRDTFTDGLLTFFSDTGIQPQSQVLSKLGVAAVVADLRSLPGNHLIVSLDSPSARRWLRRDESDLRADLLQLTLHDDDWTMNLIEVKSRSSETIQLNGFINDAIEQAEEMKALLEQTMSSESTSPLAASRREIIKRQLFFEALRQWDQIKDANQDEYTRRIEALSKLFDDPTKRASTLIQASVYIVGMALDSGSVKVDGFLIPVKVLGHAEVKEQLGFASDDVTIEIAGELADLNEQGNESETDEHRPTQSSKVGTLSELATEPRQERPDLEEKSIPADGAEPERVSASADLSEPALDWTEIPSEISHRCARILSQRDSDFTRIDLDALVIGPSVIQVPFEIATGARLSKLQSQEGDIARDLGVPSVRVDNLVGRPGFAVVEVPRSARMIPKIDEILRADFENPDLEIALGVQFDFSPFIISVSEMPHLLVAGKAGGGKTVLVRSLLWQLVENYSPDEVELILIDGKGMRDFRDFQSLPHFQGEDSFHIGTAGALERLEKLVDVELPGRIAEFNRLTDAEPETSDGTLIRDLRELRRAYAVRGEVCPLKPVVVVIDEFAELALTSTDRKKFDALVTSFVQKARAAGGHLIAATQRPSVDVITGTMKANFSRLALKVESKVDSQVILDATGAEALLGFGDALFRSQDGDLIRLQGYDALAVYRGNPAS